MIILSTHITSQGGKCGFGPHASEMKFIDQKKSARNAGSLESGMTQKEGNAAIKTRQRSQGRAVTREDCCSLRHPIGAARQEGPNRDTLL